VLDSVHAGDHGINSSAMFSHRDAQRMEEFVNDYDGEIIHMEDEVIEEMRRALHGRGGRGLGAGSRTTRARWVRLLHEFMEHDRQDLKHDVCEPAPVTGGAARFPDREKCMSYLRLSISRN
jgi:hypothetical protein